MSAAVAENDRRLANLIRFGHVSSLDEANARVKVDCGDLTTDWLPWATLRAGPDKTWHAPEVGEQVLVLAPSGDMAQAAVLPAFYSDANPAPANVKTKHLTKYQDGTEVQYDRAAHQMRMTLNAAGNFLFEVGGSKIEMNTSHIKLTSNGSTLEMDAAGVRINGARIDLN